jgi:hypothetical protein
VSRPADDRRVSEFTAIRATSKTLQGLLQAHITDSAESQLHGVPIDLSSPKEMRDGGTTTPTNGISLWLYRVARNADVLNHPRQRGEDGLLRHPVPLDLHYLVAPITSSAENEQALLGRALQVLWDHAIIGGLELADDLAGEASELRLTLETLSLEELTRIWNALDESYQLSVSYRVQVVSIESGHEPVQAQPVLSRRSAYDEIVEVR